MQAANSRHAGQLATAEERPAHASGARAIEPAHGGGPCRRPQRVPAPITQPLQEGLARAFGQLAVGPRVQLRLLASRVRAEEAHELGDLLLAEGMEVEYDPELGHQAADPAVIAADRRAFYRIEVIEERQHVRLLPVEVDSEPVIELGPRRLRGVCVVHVDGVEQRLEQDVEVPVVVAEGFVDVHRSSPFLGFLVEASTCLAPERFSIRRAISWARRRLRFRVNAC
jgi:hypothetical protein